jgi:hypothetical protein
MAERPLLALPRPTKERPRTSGFPRETVEGIPAERQAQRLGPKFDRLSRVLPEPAQLAELRNDPSAIVPERALVFEVTGSTTDFYRAVRGVPGLEFLGEDEGDVPPTEDFSVAGKPEKDVPVRFYFTIPDERALHELVSLWERFQRGEPLGRGRAEWRKVFEHLADVRPWGPRDRLTPEALEDWGERLNAAAEAPVTFEVEYWYREDAGRREHAQAAFAAEIGRLGGQVLQTAEIAEIRYHASLIRIRADVIRDLMDHPESGVATFDDVMMLRPQSLIGAPVGEEPEIIPDDNVPVTEPDAGPPVVALLDGLPMAGHVRLAGRLDIDDPDDFAARYGSVAEQRHGTAMASLILNGDINAGGAPLDRRLYVRPVLVPEPNPLGTPYEQMPPDQLGIDLMWRSFVRMFEGEGGEPAAAPNVRIVNLSLGDAKRRFAGTMSPWTRLIDYFSWRYGLLIFVSAGNISATLPLDAATWNEIETATPEGRQAAVLGSILKERAHRRLLSPSESINCLTIGAAHRDQVAPNGFPAMAVDPYASAFLPNVTSALGLGFRRGVKPDILMPGGRELVRTNSTHAPIYIGPVAAPGMYCGVRVACPGVAGETNRSMHNVGTSVANALATHSALRILDALEELPDDAIHPAIDPAYHGVILKTLVVHSASWDADCVAALRPIINADGSLYWEHEREELARFLGYGCADIERVLDCTEGRACFVGWGSISAGENDRYRVPLPPGLEGARGFRAVSATAGWLTPVNLNHRMYRMAKLEVYPGSDKALSLGVDPSRSQPSHYAVARGTVTHKRWEGEKATPFVDGGDLVLDVSCKAAAGELDTAIPYAVAVSVEVGPDVQVAVYEEIVARLRAAVPIRPR